MFFLASMVYGINANSGDGMVANASAISQPYFTASILLEGIAFLGSIALVFRSWRKGFIMIPITLFLAIALSIGSILERITG